MIGDRLEDRFAREAARRQDAGDDDGASVLRNCAHVADMVRRVGDRADDTFYRREKALLLLEGAVDLVRLLAELDGPELDDATAERLYETRRDWAQQVVRAASAMWQAPTGAD